MKTLLVTDLLAAYERTATGESTARSRHAAAGALRRVTGYPDASPVTVDALPRAFRAYHGAQAARIEESSQRDALTLKVSTNSTLRQAVSVFARVHRLPANIRDRCTVADALRKLVKELYFRIPSKRASRAGEVTPEVLAATVTAWQTLPRDEFLAVGLAMAFGLRASEIVQVKNNWFRQRAGQWWLDNGDDTATTKDHTGALRVRALDPFFSILKSRAEKEWLLTDGPLVKLGLVKLSANVARWLESLGWKTKKKLHALRDYSSTLVACRYDLLAARDFCRHASITTTERNYTSMIDLVRVDDKSTLTVNGQPVQWASTFNPQHSTLNIQ